MQFPYRMAAVAMLAPLIIGAGPAMAQKKPNIVMLMTDDTGWNDFGAYTGGDAALGHPTPNIDRIAKEGAVFTSWYGQASCTAGRASFMTGRIPIRSALSIVVAPGDENALRKDPFEPSLWQLRSPLPGNGGNYKMPTKRGLPSPGGTARCDKI